MQKSVMLSVAAASLLSAASSAFAAGIWVPANVPAGGSDFTLFDINDKNIVVGVYTDASGVQQGVFGPFDGSNYQNIEPEPRALNDKLWIVGFETETSLPWERAPSGTLKYITRGRNLFQGTANGISNANIFVGGWTNSEDIAVGGIGLHFKWTGKIKCTIKNTGCAFRGIDAAGDAGGWYYDSNGIQHGFYQPAGGAAVKIDYPSAYYTVLEGLNDEGRASGQWEDASGVIHGFVYNIARKSYTSLDAPGALFTQVWGINNRNVIAVSAAESSGTESFVYCISPKGCPSGGAVVRHPAQHGSGKALPQAN